MNKTKTLGEIITEGRKERGLTLEEASERVNISRTTYARLEADKSKLISLDNFLDISNGLEIDLFKMIKAYGKKIRIMQIKSALKISKLLYYENHLIDSSKLEQLIKQNIDYLKIDDLV